jgi:hypothetical protein
MPRRRTSLAEHSPQEPGPHEERAAAYRRICEELAPQFPTAAERALLEYRRSPLSEFHRQQWQKAQEKAHGSRS